METEDITRYLYIGAMISAPIITLVAAIAVYLNFRFTPGGFRRSIFFFALGALGAGVVAGLVGTVVGMPISCFFLAQREYCQVGGMLFGGPLAFYLGLAAYLYFWAKKGIAS